ncbi:serine hydrolase [Paenarthrobacter aurescens]|uniref:Esterase n=1 Tax=Paenarthrobacter aurescens TaxID=43663 RepID=A0A4Y3NFA4_PAEAU|nr:serine hydrolase domain-containing protein [Paenarthrobacter aurescens]MDO6145728.1 beta-lactamase family protein [Paenarthrobacter aurescens]MDO6156972.1 beta-lactamase family protein [Paenarthrobacter aurescens]MDO6160958.1 beta-lactamase family protein [Paenarthrobacter aurescens]GEB19135.1 esterase [Paenarthrobacter aurescens]
MMTTGPAVDWARKQVELGRVPVAVLGIASSRGVEDIVAFGSDAGRHAATDDHFALFSVTKPITALTVMRQVELGRLSLAAPLADSLPGFGAGRTDTVTLEQLLSHRSGIADPALDDGIPLREALTSAGQAFYAGSLVQYCNIAFEGAAALAERAAGRPFEEQLLALAADTGAHGLTFNTESNPHTVHGTDAAGLDVQAMYKNRHPGAGLFGTAADLLNLGSELLRDSGNAVRPATLAAMRRPRTTEVSHITTRPKPLSHTGLGFQMPANQSELFAQGIYGHPGWSGTEWWMFPEQDRCVVFLTNVLDAPEYGVDTNELFNAVAAS